MSVFFSGVFVFGAWMCVCGGGIGIGGGEGEGWGWDWALVVWIVSVFVCGFR
jgi:hypothetical protein